MNSPATDNILTRYAPPAAVAGALAMLCWAGSIIAARDVAGVVPPAAMSFLRCVLALMILYPICRRSLRVQWPLMRRHWKIIGLLGILLFIGGNGMLFVGLQFTSAISAALINSAEPVVIVAVAWAMFRDRLTMVQWIGVIVSVIGVLYLIGRGDISVLLGLDLNIGDVFVLISVVSWAFYAVLTRRVPRELDRLNLVFGILVAGAVTVFPFWILENIFYKPTPLIWETVWTTGFNAVFASILALLWWNHAVEKLGPGRAGLFVHLIPVYTVILAMSLLGEQPYFFHAIGIGLIAIGIFLTTMLKSERGEILMKKQRIREASVGEPPVGTWSNCLVIDRHVYIAGMTSRSDEFDIIVGDNAYDQSKVIFDKIRALIEAAGGTMADIVKVNVFLTDINDRQQVWEARREYFDGDFPVSTLLEISKLVHPDMLVEIEAVGILGAGGD